MNEDWEIVSKVTDLLLDGKWHDMDEIGQICPLTEKECKKVLKSIEDTGFIEIRREDGEISEIRKKETLEDFKKLPEEK